MSALTHERRVRHDLRDHIDCLLAAGAYVISRHPIQLDFHGLTLTVQDGILINKGGPHGLIEVLAELEWTDKHTRNVAMDICIRQLNHANITGVLNCPMSNKP